MGTNWKWVKWGTQIHFALAPSTAEGKFKSSSDNLVLSGLAAECLSAKRGYCQKKTPQTALSVYFPGTKNLQVRVVDAITLPGAGVQQPLTPFQWHLFQQVPLNPRDTSAMVYD